MSDSRLRMRFLQQIEPVSPTRKPEPKIQVVWNPQWYCQNYAKAGKRSEKCPYCPLGFSEGYLTFEGKKVQKNKLANLEDIVAFFQANATFLDHMFDICGGEPLLYPHLDKVLGRSLQDPWRWGMTSNSLHTPMIQKLKETGALKRCWCWTASWHPHSKQENLFARNLLLIRSGLPYDVQLRSTVVVTEQTIERIDEIVEFLESLPLDGYQFHCNALGAGGRGFSAGDGTLGKQQKELELEERLRAKVGEDTFAVKVSTYLLPPREPRKCNYRTKLLAITPDGQVFACTTKAYQGLDPIGKANENFLIQDLSKETAVCALDCLSPCDYVKHVDPTGPTPPSSFRLAD